VTFIHISDHLIRTSGDSSSITLNSTSSSGKSKTTQLRRDALKVDWRNCGSQMWSETLYIHSVMVAVSSMSLGKSLYAGGAVSMPVDIAGSKR
jgi:hypothetical protein